MKKSSKKMSSMFDKLYQTGNAISMSEIFGGDTPTATQEPSVVPASTLVGAGNGDCHLIGDGCNVGKNLIIFGEQCNKN